MSSTQSKINALHKAAETAPEYATLTPFFSALYSYVQGREAETGISFNLTLVNRAERTAHGFPLVSPNEMSIDQEMLFGFLLGVVDVLRQQGTQGEEALDRIARVLSNGEINPKPLLLAILERRRGPLDEAALALGVPAPLLEYIFEVPCKTALEQLAADLDPGAFPGWQENFCPVCGSRAGMAELVGEEGRRQLCCSACSFAWSFQRLKCPSCGCEDADKLSYFTAGDGATRVDTCGVCSRYIKTRDARKGGSEVPLEVEDLLTIHLDLMASREGFERGK